MLTKTERRAEDKPNLKKNSFVRKRKINMKRERESNKVIYLYYVDVHMAVGGGRGLEVG